MNRLNLIRNHLKQSEQPTQPSIIVESYQNNSKIKFVRLNNLKNLNALSNEFGNEILNALHKYIGHKFNLSIVDLSKEKIAEMLLARQVTNDTTKNTIDLLNTCEYAKYAPGAVSGDLQTVYKNTVELIADLEEQLNKKV